MGAWVDQKSEVQQATDIVALIGDQVALKPSGREFIGLCPFHDDKNPSMHVSPVKQIYKCFSCGAGGNAFNFVINFHKMSFPEALQYLADRAGIELIRARSQSDPAGGADSSSPGSDGAESGVSRQRIGEANQKALEFFQRMLRNDTHGRIARDYLVERGISEQMIESFGLGYAPDAWDGLARAVGQSGWDVPAFVAAGLIQARNRGDGYTDRLRHRLIFPIFDPIGRPIAFGGRVLPGGTLDDKNDAKYLNSPETPLFDKSSTLYGLHLAHRPIAESGTAVVVEGYTDVIACHQAGQCNVVAALGTSLTVRHMHHLRRRADKTVLIFDADEAGQKAADRAVEIFLAGETDVAVAVLPQGLDPDELLALPDGTDRWQAAVREATDALDYQLSRLRTQLDETETLTGRQHAIEAYLGRLAELGLMRLGPVRRGLVIQRLSMLLQLPEETLMQMLTKLPSRRVAGGGSGVASGGASGGGSGGGRRELGTGRELADMTEAGVDSGTSEADEHVHADLRELEKHLIGSLLRRPSLFHDTLDDGGTLDEAITPLELFSGPARRLYGRVYDWLSEERELTLADLLTDLADDGGSELAELATTAERELELICGDDDERQVRVFQDVAARIISHHRRCELMTAEHVSDRGLPHVDADGAQQEEGLPADASDEETNRAERLKRLREFKQAHRSPLRLRRYRQDLGVMEGEKVRQ